MKIKDSVKFKKKLWNEIRLLIFIIFVSFLSNCFFFKNNPCIIKNFLTPFDWWKWLFIFLVAYALIRLYKDWIIRIWEFLMEDKIVHFIFMIFVPIGIIFFVYILFFPEISISVKNSNENEILARLIETDKLIGFYASLIALIGVLVAIAGRIVWQKIQEAHVITEKLREVEGKVNFLNKEKELAEWAIERIDKLGLNTFRIENLTPDDRSKIENIKEFILNDWTNRAWLELFLAHHVMTEEKNFEKAENLYEFIEKRIFLNETNEHLPTLNHFKGQLYWEKYRYFVRESKLNFFNIADDSLKKPDKKKIGEAISILNKSKENYMKAIDYVDKFDHKGTRNDPSKTNFGLVLIELSKFYYNDNANQKENYLNLAEKSFECVVDKDHNTYYGLARIHYYKNNMEKAQRYFEQFQRRVELLEEKEKFIIRNRFEDHIDIEKKQFSGEGFPSKLYKNTFKKTP